MALPGTISFRDKVLQHLENEPEVSSAIKLNDDNDADLSDNTEENSEDVLSVESEDEDDDIMSDDEDDDIMSDEQHDEDDDTGLPYAFGEDRQHVAQADLAVEGQRDDERHHGG